MRVLSIWGSNRKYRRVFGKRPCLPDLWLGLCFSWDNQLKALAEVPVNGTSKCKSKTIKLNPEIP